MSMREYAKLGPTFWTGTTGKALRKRGTEALLVALYLVSAPGSNMLGLYYQPLPFMAHETGLGIEGASKGLRDCIACGFCSYDEDSEMVFVHEMAAWQIAEALEVKDKRCAGVQREYDAMPENPFLGAFFDRYAQAFHLQNRRGDKPPDAPDDTPPAPPNISPLQGASEAPSKPHRSQEQEQEHEQKTEVDTQPGVSVDNSELRTPYGQAWGLLHRLGVVNASPSDPVFRAMVDKGVTDDELRAAVEKAARKGRNDAAYVAGIVTKQRQDAEALAAGTPGKPAPIGAGTVPPVETAAEYMARMAAVRAAEATTPEQAARAKAARDVVLAKHGRRRAKREEHA